MIAAPLPHDEVLRLLALQGHKLLDTPPEAFFDDMVELACTHFKVPIALVSLIDSNRQWFKAKCGVEAAESCREHAFCAHAILDPEIFEVTDARADQRFHDNPFVTEPPHIRFYAGCPIMDDAGHYLGTLCIIDREPRKLTEHERQTLHLMAKLVSDHIQVRDLLNTLVGEPKSPPSPTPTPDPE
ncbi:MAG: GAF domain-containing protein [Planctomycetota bacterium]